METESLLTSFITSVVMSFSHACFSRHDRVTCLRLFALMEGEQIVVTFLRLFGEQKCQVYELNTLSIVYASNRIDDEHRHNERISYERRSSLSLSQQGGTHISYSSTNPQSMRGVTWLRSIRSSRMATFPPVGR